MNFEYLEIEQQGNIATLWINNPHKANCLNQTLWFELGQAVEALNQNKNNRVIILRGKGKHFSSGIDTHFLKSIQQRCLHAGAAERETVLYQQIIQMQQSFSQFQDSKLPIIALIHGACIGGAIDLIAACDIRFCTYRTVFSIMETKLGIVTDMGTLQRLRFSLSESDLRYLSFTSDLFGGRKAKKLGLVSRCFFSLKAMEKQTYRLAKKLANMPHEALTGSKQVLNYSREHRVDQGLEYVARFNARALQTLDLTQLPKQK